MNNEISKDIRYIGADDLDLDLFESQYICPEGMTYNSWVILDDKIAIMDTIDQRCAQQWRDNLDSVLDGREPSYLVVQHLEPDHSALIKETMDRFPQLTLIGSVACLRMLPQFFDGETFEGRTQTVKDGDTLELGSHTLQFLTAPMVHWPEVIMTYERSEHVLFSADAFGKFGALCHEKEDDWACEARRYYFNICGKYGAQVMAALKKVEPMKVDVIAPLHGPILRGRALRQAVHLYYTWSSYKPEKEGVFIAYGSFHGGTAEAAHELARMLQEQGVDVEVKDLAREDMAEAVESAFERDTTVIMAPSYDAGLMPVVADFLHHLESKAWQRRRVAIVENGSWAPSAARVIKSRLAPLKDLQIIEPTVTIRTRLNPASRAQLATLATALAPK
ncbi:MAG: FprA family A-type flavoprotein [Bacteroidales bacterium]|nr:FprA family A-type flavoprotein [Bacteroidales bacterium]